MSRLYTMWNYLSEKTPDYTTTTLSVAPQKVSASGYKNVQINKGYGTSEQRIILSNASTFNVKLIWDTYLDPDDCDTIFDFYHDPDKACGIGHTFYWKSPAQYGGLTYVGRFNSNLDEFIQNFEIYNITSIDLWVCGKKL